MAVRRRLGKSDLLSSVAGSGNRVKREDISLPFRP
jgi:hypothetical protein